MIGLRKVVFLIACSLILSSCAAMQRFTPERAIVAHIMQSDDPTLSIFPSTVEVRQSVPWGDAFLVMVTYQRSGGNNLIENCQAVYATERTRTGWMAGGGGSGCITAGAANQAVDIAGGSQSGGNQPALSYTYGQVYDPKIVSIQVTWSDEQVQTIQVTNGSYLVVRSDSVSYQQVLGLDAEGEVLFTAPALEVAPGKSIP